MFYDWHFARITPYLSALAVSAVVTIELTLVTVIIGGILGSVLGLLLARRAGTWLLSAGVDLIRSIPPLVLILFFYYFLTKEVVGIAIPSFWVFSIAMSINMAAFTADIVRSSIISVPKEAVEAARALGFSEAQITLHISAEYIIRQALPGMSVLIIAMLKTSSLAAIVNVREVVYTAQTILAETARSLEVWVVVGIIYTILVLPTTYASKRVEAWARRGERKWIG